MDPEPEREPSVFDPRVPDAARIYNYLLAGKDNYAVDRKVGDRLIKNCPEVPRYARENREFVLRAVRFLAGGVGGVGVEQFVDIGCGLPAPPDNVHEVAQRANPRARVMYLDWNPVAVTQARALMANDQTDAAEADLLDPEGLWEVAQIGRLLDLSQPVAVLLGAVLHLVGEDADPYAVVRRLTEPLAAGSFLVISHALDTREMRKLAMIYQGGDGTPRSRGQILQLFAGFELISPGLVPVPRWRPDYVDRTVQARWEAEPTPLLGGVGLKVDHPSGGR